MNPIKNNKKSILILAWGSMGDVAPSAVIAKICHNMGMLVSVVAFYNYRNIYTTFVDKFY